MQLVSLLAGGIAAHAQVAWALEERDATVANAQSGATLGALRDGDRFRAAGLDFAGNVASAAVTSITGITIVFAFGLTAYRGWVGGIVSVDGAHHSRLASFGAAAYYLSVVTLQSIGFVLSAAGGVRAGLSWLRPRREDGGKRILGVPAMGLRDMLVMGGLALPFFAVGSLVEFLAQ